MHYKQPGVEHMRFLGTSVWLFPILLTIALLSATALRIQGSSIGSYHKIIYGAKAEDPNLIYGTPQSIRSDEWLLNTQLTLAQEEAGYPRVNENMANGRDMSLNVDVPYKEWSALFKPQNLVFFILPLDYAFAFKWWLLLYLLILGAYFFTLRLFPRKRLFAVLISLGFALSPFVGWWYVTGTLAPLFYGFFILILLMRIFNEESIRFLRNKKSAYTIFLYIVALAYLLMAFALILYPPFQIPVAIVVSFFAIGYLLNKRFSNKLDWKYVASKMGICLLSLIIVGILLGFFISTRKEAINALTGTVYPAQRTVGSGGIDPHYFFDSFLQPQLPLKDRGTHFLDNQSEASNFILLSPFLILPAAFLTIREYINKCRIDWLFVSIQAIVLLFVARIFLPYGDRIYKILFLDRVPHERLIIGIGFASILLTLLVLKKLDEIRKLKKLYLLSVGLYSLVSLAFLIWLGFRISNIYPQFISYGPKIVLFAAFFSAIIFSVLIKRKILAATLILIFSIASVIQIHPLYRGLGWIDENRLFTKMQEVSVPSDTWAVADTIVFENFALLANRDTISGIQPYPDLKLWSQDDANPADIYNRFAHVLFISNPPFSEPLQLVQPDFFLVGFSCNKFIKKNVDFLLNTSVIDHPCIELKDKVTFPAATFYIYQVQDN